VETLKTAYSDEEWEILQVLPIIVGAAVARITRSGPGGLLELKVLWNAIHKTHHTSPLLNALSIDLRSSEGRSTISDGADWEYEGPGQRLLLGRQAVAACKKARPLVDRATEEDAAAYRAWIVEVGTRVADAARERPGSRINNTEARLIEKIRVAIGA